MADLDRSGHECRDQNICDVKPARKEIDGVSAPFLPALPFRNVDRRSAIAGRSSLGRFGSDFARLTIALDSRGFRLGEGMCTGFAFGAITLINAIEQWSPRLTVLRHAVDVVSAEAEAWRVWIVDNLRALGEDQPLPDRPERDREPLLARLVAQTNRLTGTLRLGRTRESALVAGTQAL